MPGCLSAPPWRLWLRIQRRPGLHYNRVGGEMLRTSNAHTNGNQITSAGAAGAVHGQFVCARPATDAGRAYSNWKIQRQPPVLQNTVNTGKCRCKPQIKWITLLENVARARKQTTENCASCNGCKTLRNNTTAPERDVAKPRPPMGTTSDPSGKTTPNRNSSVCSATVQPETDSWRPGKTVQRRGPPKLASPARAANPPLPHRASAAKRAETPASAKNSNRPRTRKRRGRTNNPRVALGRVLDLLPPRRHVLRLGEIGRQRLVLEDRVRRVLRHSPPHAGRKTPTATVELEVHGVVPQPEIGRQRDPSPQPDVTQHQTFNSLRCAPLEVVGNEDPLPGDDLPRAHAPRPRAPSRQPASNTGAGNP